MNQMTTRAVLGATVAMPRVRGFDLLRGVCALAVALYHVLSWQQVADLHSWGRYGVYLFFLLSGASMFLAYDQKFQAGYSPLKFILLRLTRLMPLFGVLLVLKLAYGLALGRPIPEQLGLFYLNVLFIFGLGNPGDSSSLIGGWSLGIECLFYLMFPIITAAVRSRACAAIVVLAFIGQHVFIARTVGTATLEQVWGEYTHMLSFIYYFIAGCAIGKRVRAGALDASAWAWPAVALLLIPLATLNGESNLLGWTGMGLSLAAAALVAAAAALPLRGLAVMLADTLGKMSYGLYLIHPFVYTALEPALRGWPPSALCALVLALSAALALVAERFLEAPSMAWAQRRVALARPH